MDEEPQVFSSNITRRAKPFRSDLADLLKVVPAEAVLQKKYETRNTCDFKPKIKYYEPKRKSKLKVRTVRDIRNLYEKDVYSTLLVELEKQQNVLLRKIKSGSRDENTKTLTKNMLKCDKPVSRSAWQMLTNLNPEEYPYSTQFVLWNGKRIRVNGSKGGTCKFMCKYDLGKLSKKAKSSAACKPFLKKKGLLQNSLSVNFKPGPLGKKILLDHSYQKYHVGGIEVQHLPKPALEIQPTVGKTIDPIITHYLNNMRPADGIISNQWAQFSVSTLATAKNETVNQIDDECCVTFDLNYKCDQQRILMRRDVNSDFSSKPLNNTDEDQHFKTVQDSVLTSEIQNVLDQIIDCVEISLEQDNMYTGEDEPRDVSAGDSITDGPNIQPKESRMRRRHWNAKELERLDVTIIRLAENVDQHTINTCPKAYCNLGCVCTSLSCAYNLKSHCGRVECMFECKCDFSKYRVVDSMERDCSELLPGLLKLDIEKSSKMAKEEQKFHHTVIVTPENSMLLKSRRRDWKSSKKYADFYSSMCLKNDNVPEKVATLSIEKLNLPNVEPWCMVHNLYKCFCKGRFTDHSLPDDKPVENNADNAVQKDSISEDLTDKVEKTNIKYGMKTHMLSVSHGSNSHMKPKSDLNELYQCAVHDSSFRSARVKPYRGRKFTDGYYINANKKIFEMEQHDYTLRKRMINLINTSICSDETQVQNVEEPVSSQSENSMDSIQEQNTEKPIRANKVKVLIPTLPPLTPAPAPSIPPIQTPEHQKLLSPTPPPLLSPPPLISPSTLQSTGAFGVTTKVSFFTNRWLNKEKLVAWIGQSYKRYKQRMGQGVAKNSLEPPKAGGMALHPWDFILGRYRDRKNVFLITIETPYRLFMAVDQKHPFFKNCININEIRFADLQKYPVTVKQLLTNEKDLKDNFLILSGLPYCWELIGSVTKMGEQQEIKDTMSLSDEDLKDNLSETSTDTFHHDSEDSNAGISLNLQGQEEETIGDNKIVEEINEIPSDSSRWFVMTVENDFDEIQFYNKGFFVKLESIIKAINVARASKKTVRLSSQKCVDFTGPQFGIYAIPNENESCVFVGPYEKNESLGIETVKKMSDIGKQKRTKGVWITTKKLENFNVIDNPLSFMPPKNAPDAEMMTLADVTTNINNKTDSFVEMPKSRNKSQNSENNKKQITKVLKPIKIGKTNNFYQLAPNGTLKQINQQRFIEQKQKSGSTETNPNVINKSLLKQPETSHVPLLSSSSSILKCIPKRNLSNVNKTVATITKKPVAEIAPHVKQTTKCPESIDIPKPKDESASFFVLKPEEINKRLMQTQMSSNLEHLTESGSGPDPEIEMDIENFLATAEECEAPHDDILIISDDETDLQREKNVWIECKTVEGLGWIRGKKNFQNLISFEFPGFKYTEFYKEEEAFAKLNQVLSRKIYIPKTIQLEWHVVESEQELCTKQMLKQEELGPNFVMTRRGIRHKQDLMITVNSSKTSPQQPKHILELEAESQLLEEKGEALLNSLKNNTDHSLIGEGLKEIGDRREEIAARLQCLISDK